MTIKKTGGIFGRNPTFNDVEAESLTIAGNAVPDASTILVDGDIGSTVQGYDADTTKNDVSNTFTADQFFDEKVAIGHTTAFTPLYMRNDSDTDYNPASSTFNTIASFANWTSGALNNSLIAFNTESNGEWYIGGVQNAGNTAADFVFAARNAGVRAEKVRFTADGNIVIPTSGNGIDFSATAGTGTSELLSDYEEGTYTATLTPDSGSITLQYNQLKYTKIGRLVTIMGLLRVSTVSSPTGYLALNLPFAISTGSDFSNRSGSAGYGSGLVSLNSNEVHLAATEGLSAAYFIDTSGATSSGAAMGQQFQAATEFFVTLSYHTN